jgi:H+-transporting ATPase
MVIMNETLDLRLIVLLAIFADIATLAIAYDNASYSQLPVKWNQPKLWGESIILGFILAAGTWVTLGTMLLQGDEGGVIQGWGSRDEVLFLEITLTQSWLILVTRITGSMFSNRPSALLAGAVLVVDVTGSLMARFGAFGTPTSALTILRVWILAFGVACVNAIVYILLHNSEGFDNLMHGRSLRNKGKDRSWEDFGKLKPNVLKCLPQRTNGSKVLPCNAWPPSMKEPLEENRKGQGPAQSMIEYHDDESCVICLLLMHLNIDI